MWALQFHDLFNWAFAAIIGNTLTGWKDGGLVADNSNDAFLTILTGSIQHNAFFAFYFTFISVLLLALLNKKIPIIGVGGVDSGESAFEKIASGATAIQLYTGMVYKGPNIVSEIKKDLISILKKEKIKNISDAVGINA